jgi:hypothetical protein
MRVPQASTSTAMAGLLHIITSHPALISFALSPLSLNSPHLFLLLLLLLLPVVLALLLPSLALA